MELLIFIALLIVVILLFNIKASQKETASRTHQSFLSLKKELLEIKEVLNNMSLKEGSVPVKATDENVVQWRPGIAPEITEPVVEPVDAEVATSTISEPALVIPEKIAPAYAESPALPNEPVKRSPAPAPAEGWLDKWLRNNPDLEKFIGENLINKIGISVLVLGIAFFVKYAIDQNWIKEAGRVSIGIGCGAVLIAFAHYLRNSYRSFSSVLAGGGIAVFYFTIAFAFHEYQLFSQTAAFIIMVIITVFAVLLSLLYDKPELAVIAITGGFITPFLASTGTGNYIVLFTYLLILNIGMLILAYFKKWHAINVIALFFTVFIYGGWLIKNTALSNGFPFYKNSFLFATAFYLLFLGMHMIHNILARIPFKALDFSLLMLTTFSYFAGGITNLHYWDNGAYQGIFTMAMGIVNFCLAIYFYRTGKGDKNLLYLLIGLTLTFLSLAAPVQLHGHTITLFWSAEFVLIYWLYQRSGIGIFKYSSFIVIALALISLLIDWTKANDANGEHLTIIYSNLQGFITNIIAIAAFTIYAALLRKEQPNTTYIFGIKNKTAALTMILLAAMILYLTGIFGPNLYFYESRLTDVTNTWHQLITYSFIALLLLVIQYYRLSISAVWQMLLIAACVCMYLPGIPAVIRLRNGVLQHDYTTIHLWVHWLSAIMLLYLVYRAVTLYRNNNAIFFYAGKLVIWLINIVLITIFSVECLHAYVFTTASFENINTSIQQYSKAGLTIVWGLCSFVIMWLGMKYKYKTLRIISLVVFSLALLKLFLFDIRNISEGGKIAAFIMLGILLLVISFMYQKLKKIIIDDASQ